MEISAGEMAQWLSAQTALAEDLSDCPAPISGDSQQPGTQHLSVTTFSHMHKPVSRQTHTRA